MKAEMEQILLLDENGNGSLVAKDLDEAFCLGKSTALVQCLLSAGRSIYHQAC